MCLDKKRPECVTLPDWCRSRDLAGPYCSRRRRTRRDHMKDWGSPETQAASIPCNVTARLGSRPCHTRGRVEQLCCATKLPVCLGKLSNFWRDAQLIVWIETRPPSTSDCLIFRVTSVPDKLWHSSPCGYVVSYLAKIGIGDGTSAPQLRYGTIT